MRINFISRRNFFSFLSVLVICITLLIALNYALKNASSYYEYQKYISDNTKDNIDFYYSCDDGWSSVMYNCDSNLQKKNLTGYYCNNTLICENSYKIIGNGK
jgi:hypothetical protein